MFFSKNDFQKIEQYFKDRAKKDTDFLQTQSVSGEDTMAIVQDGVNKRISLDVLFEQFRSYIEQNYVVDPNWDTHEAAIDNYISTGKNHKFIYDVVYGAGANSCGITLFSRKVGDPDSVAPTIKSITVPAVTDAAAGLVPSSWYSSLLYYNQNRSNANFVFSTLRNYNDYIRLYTPNEIRIENDGESDIKVNADGGDINLIAANDIQLSATENINLTAETALTLTSHDALTLISDSIEETPVTIQGFNLNLNADGGEAHLTADSKIYLSGDHVEINGDENIKITAYGSRDAEQHTMVSGDIILDAGRDIYLNTDKIITSDASIYVTANHIIDYLESKVFVVDGNGYIQLHPFVINEPVTLNNIKVKVLQDDQLKELTFNGTSYAKDTASISINDATSSRDLDKNNKLAQIRSQILKGEYNSTDEYIRIELPGEITASEFRKAVSSAGSQEWDTDTEDYLWFVDQRTGNHFGLTVVNAPDPVEGGTFILWNIQTKTVIANSTEHYKTITTRTINTTTGLNSKYTVTILTITKLT